MLALPIAIVVSAVCESFLYGALLVIFFASVKISYARAERELSSVVGTVSSQTFALRTWRQLICRPVMIGSIGLFVTTTLHWITIINRLCTALHSAVSAPGTVSDAFLEAVYGYPGRLFTSLLVYATLLIANFMLIYRTWILYNKTLAFVVLPLVSLAAFLVAAIGTTWWIVRATGLGSTTGMGKWVIAVYTCDAVTSFYCTSALSFRIYKSNKQMREVGGVNRFPFVSILLESAVLYSICMLIFMILYMVEDNSYLIPYNAMSAVSAIAFLLIQLRVELRTMSSRDAVAHVTVASLPVLVSGVGLSEGNSKVTLGGFGRKQGTPRFLTEEDEAGEEKDLEKSSVSSPNSSLDEGTVQYLERQTGSG